MKKDLAVLVADKNMDFALRGILERPQAIAIRPVSYEIKVHGSRDGGVRTTGPETLATLKDQFLYGLLMLDWDGSGADDPSSNDLESSLGARLRHHWDDRARAIVIVPELDVWVWGSDNALGQVLKWKESRPIREWIAGRGYELDPRNQKPLRPKEALNAVMYHINRPRSSSIYKGITSKISLGQCVDPAFNRLKTTLQEWFSPQIGREMRIS